MERDDDGYPRCEFCGRDPYHYVDIGVGWEPVAVICCELAIEAYAAHRNAQKPEE